MRTTFTVSIDGKIKRKSTGLRDYDFYLKRKIAIWSETLKYTNEYKKSVTN